MNTNLAPGIPANRVNWTGLIQMTLTCDNNYDFPLNAPRRGLFTCRPDGKSWEPSYMPDCNPKTLPTSIDIAAAVFVPKDVCEATSEGTEGDTSVTIDEKTADVSTLCSGSNLRQCTLRVKTPVCANDFTGLSTEHEAWAMELHVKAAVHNRQGPFVFVVISASFDATRDYDSYNKSFQSVKENIADTWWLSVEASLKAECVGARIGVVDKHGSIVCRGCSAGHGLDRRSKRCEKCIPGKYQDEPERTNCKHCPSMFAIDASSELWRQVKDAGVPDRSYSLIYCPSIQRNPDGTFTVTPSGETIGKPRLQDQDGRSFENGASMLQPSLVGVAVTSLMCVVSAYI